MAPATGLPIEEHDGLQPAESAAVLSLAQRAAAHDDVRPLSEQTLLQVRRRGASTSRHLLVRDGERIVGYGHVDLADEARPSGELVIDPDHRRRGLGGALLDEVLARWPQVRLWSHGDLQDARRLYTSRRLVVVRELWQMSRPLTGEWSALPSVPVDLPDTLRVRSYRVGPDDEAWLRVNARAFADHAEQGRMTLTDLRERQAEPWFDPEGFIVIEDLAAGSTTDADAERGDDHDGGPVIAAFHWTKIEPDQPQVGEVYVVGVDPAQQGRGLGRAVTLLGLHHLARRGVETATLYVDADNAAAVTTYHRLGFERSAVDVMYASGAVAEEAGA